MRFDNLNIILSNKLHGLFSLIIITGFAAMLILLSSCGSAKTTKPNSEEEVYKAAIGYFEEEDYMEAKKLFEVIKLQYPAGQYADDAQYHVAEINFNRDQFIIASFNYNLLRRIYPGSQYNQKALYKSGLCYYHLSPPFDRDPEYTKKAIQTLMEFQYLYPNDSLYAEASEKIGELREKLAHKEFFTAELYEKLDSPKSSLIYYNAVISDYDDTSFYEKAYKGKIDILIRIKRFSKALGIIDLYKKLFPKGEFIIEILAAETIAKKKSGK